MKEHIGVIDKTISKDGKGVAQDNSSTIHSAIKKTRALSSYIQKCSDNYAETTLNAIDVATTLIGDDLKFTVGGQISDVITQSGMTIGGSISINISRILDLVSNNYTYIKQLEERAREMGGFYKCY